MATKTVSYNVTTDQQADIKAASEAYADRVDEDGAPHTHTTGEVDAYVKRVFVQFFASEVEADLVDAARRSMPAKKLGDIT